MYTKPISQVELIEIPINQVQTKYYLGDRPYLKNKIIHRVHAITSGDLSYSPSNRQNIGNFENSFLVLVNKNKEVINRIPGSLLNPTRFSFAEFNIDIDWEKSYIEFSDTSSLTVGKSIVLVAYIVDKITEPILKGLKHELVTLLVRTTSDLKFKFDEIDFLKNKLIKKIEFIFNKAPGGTSSVGSSIFIKSFLTLSIEGEEKISYLPIDNIYSENTHVVRLWFNSLKVNWAKSYVQIANSTDLTANTSFLFSVFYEDEGTNPRDRKELKR